MKLLYLEAGQIVSTHGVRGEMKILPWSDSPEFLLDFTRVRIDGVDYPVTSCRVQKTCNLLKLQGIDSMDQAQSMRGKTVEVYRADAPEGMVFVAEMIGMEVLSDGRSIGKLIDVLDYPGNKVYVVKGEYEYMIPAVSNFVENIDMDAGCIYVRLIEGMRTDEN